MKKSYSPKNIIDSDLCIGCGICVAYASRKHNGLTMGFDSYGQIKPKGPEKWLHNPSESFSRICPFSPSADNEDELSTELFKGWLHHDTSTGRYISNYIGYAKESKFRLDGSSGGMVTWVTTMLMKKGLVDGVAHVVTEAEPKKAGRLFKYRISRTAREIREGAKSRYYPVELSEVLKTISELPGRYAVVAVPCMIKAVNLLRQTDPVFRERIRFTLGLFCGHMKSARFAESIAWQMKVPVEQVDKIDFRYKLTDRPANWYNAMILTTNGKTYSKDWWHLADGDWGAGYFMNNACNFCDDVVAETADISFGDAWIEPYSSDGKGTNAIVTRSPVLEELLCEGLNSGKIHLEEKDASVIARTQAAGLRMRREGLAYRLTWNNRNLKLNKRIGPDSENIAYERKRIYRIRYIISKWSHRVFRFSRMTGLPGIYFLLARTATAIYHGFAYHHGNLSEMKKRFAVMKTG